MPARCSNGDGRRVHSRGLCRPCWNAQRAEEGRSPRGGKVELGAVDVPDSWVVAIERTAQHQGVTVAHWRREAYRAALLLQAVDDPQLARLLVDRSGPKRHLSS